MTEQRVTLQLKVLFCYQQQSSQDWDSLRHPADPKKTFSQSVGLEPTLPEGN